MAAAETFQDYIDESFPVGAKRTRSVIICRNYAERIVSFLKDGRDEMDKNFRHMVKKSGFQLLDLPEACRSQGCIGSENDRRKASKLLVNSFKIALCKINLSRC